MHSFAVFIFSCIENLLKVACVFSQSCAVAKSEQFWRATGQSNLAGRMEDCSTSESVVVSTKTKLWKFLLRPAVRTSSMIVLWPTSISYF